MFKVMFSNLSTINQQMCWVYFGNYGAAMQACNQVLFSPTEFQNDVFKFKHFILLH